MNPPTISKCSGTSRDSLHPWLHWCSSSTLVVSVGLLCISVHGYNNHTILAVSLVPSLLVALSFAVLLSVYSLRHLRREHQETDQAFRYADCEFSSIFRNVLDGILIVDSAGICLDANPAAATILRLPFNKLIGQDVGRFLVNHSDFIEGSNSFLQNKNHRGRARLVAGDGTGLFVDYTATANYLPGRHVLIICDVTERTHAERKIVEQLGTVEAARAEAEALRKSTLALSQNLAMDSVLDTLLQCISELVPFSRATVLFIEDGFELMIARERPRIVPKRIGFTMKASENSFLEQVLFEKRARLLADVATESAWSGAPPLDHLQSWMGIPLVAAGRVLGILSLGSSAPHTFTPEHLRLAKSLAVPAAVAIQNARTHERAEIYAAGLQVRLQEINNALGPLENAERKPPRSREA